jgi:glycosyltransferase involved in cell wall biosynthesis
VEALTRIAFDARYINDRYHGIGRYAFGLLEALARAAPHHTFIVFQGTKENDRFNWEILESLPNVELEACPLPLFWPQEQLLWPWLLRRSSADLFHTPYFLVPLLAPIPMISTVQDLIFDRYPEYMPWRFSSPYYRLLMKWGTRRALHILCLSRFTAADLTRFYQTPVSKITVIPPGVDQGFIPVTDLDRREALRGKYKLARPFILSVGARRPHKNLGRLVDAYASLHGDTPHDLVLVGPRDVRFPDEAQRAVTSRGLNGRVKFLDWVDEADLAGLYSLADLLVFPSLIEGFGLPALEAMACGTPVVGADNSSLPEVVGDAGVLVDPRDVESLASAMRQLLGDEACRQRLAAAAQERSTRFAWEKAARRVLKVYAEVF